APGRERPATGHLLPGQDPLVGQQCGDGVKPFLVIRRRQVLLRRHPLDRIPELVEVVDAAADQRAVEGEHVRLPVGVEGRLVGLLLHRREGPPAPPRRGPAPWASPPSSAPPPTCPPPPRSRRPPARGAPGHAVTLCVGTIGGR